MLILAFCFFILYLYGNGVVVYKLYSYFVVSVICITCLQFIFYIVLLAEFGYLFVFAGFVFVHFWTFVYFRRFGAVFLLLFLRFLASFGLIFRLCFVCFICFLLADFFCWFCVGVACLGMA